MSSANPTSRPGVNFGVTRGPAGPPGNPRLLLGAIKPGEAATVDEQGNVISLPVVSPADVAAMLGSSASPADTDRQAVLRNAIRASTGLVDLWEAYAGTGATVKSWKRGVDLAQSHLAWIPGPGGNGWALKCFGDPEDVTGVVPIPSGLADVGNTFTFAGLINLHRGAPYGGHLFQHGNLALIVNDFRLGIRTGADLTAAQSVPVDALKDSARWHFVAIACSGGAAGVIDSTSTTRFWVDGAEVARDGAITTRTISQSGAGVLGPDTYSRMSWQMFGLWNRMLGTSELNVLNGLKAVTWQ